MNDFVTFVVGCKTLYQKYVFLEFTGRSLMKYLMNENQRERVRSSMKMFNENENLYENSLLIGSKKKLEF